MTVLLELISAPPVLFTLALGLLLVLLRSPWPWTRVGGGLLLALGLGILAAALADPGARARAFAPERLPILVFAAASAGALWAALHQALHRPWRNEAERPAWPGPSHSEALIGGLTMLVAALGALVLGAPLTPMAEPGATGGVAPWFLLGLQQLQEYFDPWVPTVLVPLLAVAGLVALPYLDVPAPASSRSDFDERRDLVSFFVLVWFLLLLLPMVGAAFLQPPDAAPVSLALERSFSERVWTLAVTPPPRAAWLRELPAVAVLGVYFLVLPRLLPRWKPTRALFGRYRARLGPRRYGVAMALALAWTLIPLKMYGRWLLGIGYFLDLPELSLRF